MVTARYVVVALVLLLATLATEAQAQAPYPPNQWHPYRGGTNCVQVSDVNGNFSCSPLVTINPTTGAFVSVLGGPVSTAVQLVIGAGSTTLLSQTGDLVMAKNFPTTVAPSGPGIGGLTLRVRPSPRVPGYCMLVAIAGNAFGQMMEFPLAFLPPAFPFVQFTTGLTPNYDFFVVDLPGGPGGC